MGVRPPDNINIPRQRPRTRLQYQHDVGGATKSFELPFVMGVMSDLSGDAIEPLAPLAGRNFFDIEMDSFDIRMKSVKPRVAFAVPNTVTGQGNLAVDIAFEKMDDFSPASIARKVDGLSKLFEARTQLNILTTSFKPPTSASREQIEHIVESIAEWPLREGTVTSDVAGTTKVIIAEIDAKLTAQVNLILHHDRFQQVESAWRGLSYLVNHTETSSELKIRVLNVSKNDLVSTLKSFDGAAWDQSPLVKMLYEQLYGCGGEPYGCLVGDYYFDHTPSDVQLLGRMAQIAAAAHTLFISSAAPTLMGMISWQELSNNPQDLRKIVRSPEHAAWNLLRASSDSKYVGLAMPRFLSRQSYGAKSNPVEEFAFEEDTGGGDHSRYTWANSAYALAANINRSLKENGWCTAICGVESGMVTNLPVDTFPSTDGGVQICPTEIALSDRHDAPELAYCGLTPLVHRKYTNVVAFISAQSLQKPVEYDDPAALANARCLARLPFLFAAERIVQYLMCIARDRPRGFASAAALEGHLNEWLGTLVCADRVSDEEVARRPLELAHLVVDPQPISGHFLGTLRIRPAYLFEKMDVDLAVPLLLPCGYL